MRLRLLDYVALVVSILAVVSVSLFAYGTDAAPDAVSIQSDDGEYLYPLDDSRELLVEGPLGHTHVVIQDSRVRITESPCRDKICIAAGWLEHTGEWTACLPNRIFVRVEGGERDDGVDAQTF